MKSCVTRVRNCPPQASFSQEYRTGVSLHGHTMHSKEFLARLPTYISEVPIGSYILEREIGRCHLHTGRIFDFGKIFWTPPLSPREAYELEQKQIESQLGLEALVSLSDHDNIEAGIQLRMVEATANVPISLEWTLPYEETEFHIGVHNLPPSRALDWAKALTAFSGRMIDLFGLLAELHAEPEVLIVLNHPFWDAEVREIREERRSEIVLMQQYSEPLQLRLFENAWHALADAPGEFGRRHWMMRVFCIENGEPLPLSRFTSTRFHMVIDKCRWWLALLASPALRPALRLPFLGNEEGGL